MVTTGGNAGPSVLMIGGKKGSPPLAPNGTDSGTGTKLLGASRGAAFIGTRPVSSGAGA